MSKFFNNIVEGDVIPNWFSLETHTGTINFKLTLGWWHRVRVAFFPSGKIKLRHWTLEDEAYCSYLERNIVDHENVKCFLSGVHWRELKVIDEHPFTTAEMTSINRMQRKVG